MATASTEASITSTQASMEAHESFHGSSGSFRDFFQGDGHSSTEAVQTSTEASMEAHESSADFHGST